MNFRHPIPRSGKPIKKRNPKALSPRNAKTFSQICSLKRDNLSSKHGWIMIGDGGTVTIAEQSAGNEAKAIVNLSRREFNRLIDWYNQEQALP